MPNITIGSTSYAYDTNTRHYSGTVILDLNSADDNGLAERSSIVVPDIAITNASAQWDVTNSIFHLTTGGGGSGGFNLRAGVVNMADTVIVTNSSRFGCSRPSRLGDGFNGVWRNVIIQSIRGAGTAVNLGAENLDLGLTLDRVSFVGQAVLQAVPGKLYLTVDFGSGIVSGRNFRMVNGFNIANTPSMKNTWSLMWDCDLSGFNGGNGINWHAGLTNVPASGATNDVYVIGGTLPSGGTLNLQLSDTGSNHLRFRAYVGDAYAMKFVDTDGASINDIYVHKRENQSYEAFKLPDDFARDSLPTRILQTPEALTSGQLNMLATYAFAERRQSAGANQVFFGTFPNSITVSGVNRVGTIYYASYTHKAYSDAGVLQSTDIRHIQNGGNDLDFSETETITLLTNPLAVLTETEASNLETGTIENLDDLTSFVTYQAYQDFVDRTSTANVPNVQPIYGSGSIVELNGSGTINLSHIDEPVIQATGLPIEGRSTVDAILTPTNFGGTTPSFTGSNITITYDLDDSNSRTITFDGGLVGEGLDNRYISENVRNETNPLYINVYRMDNDIHIRLTDSTTSTIRAFTSYNITAFSYQSRGGNQNEITFDSTDDLMLDISENTTSLSKGTSFNTIGVGSAETLTLGTDIEVGFDMVGGTLSGLQQTTSGDAVNGAKIGTSDRPTTLTLVAGGDYTFRDADMSDAVFPVNTGDSITIRSEGNTTIPTLPSGYVRPINININIIYPDGYNPSGNVNNATLAMYRQSGESHFIGNVMRYDTLVGTANSRAAVDTTTTYNSAEITGLGTTIQNVRIVLTGIGLISIIRDYTIVGDDTIELRPVADSNFNANATIGGLSGNEVPTTVFGGRLTDIQSLITLFKETSVHPQGRPDLPANYLTIGIHGFAGSFSINTTADSALTNRMMGESKRLPQYAESVAFWGEELITLISISETLLSDNVRLTNGEGTDPRIFGIQKVTSVLAGTVGSLRTFTNVNNDVNIPLVFVNPNPEGISPTTLASVLVGRGVRGNDEILERIDSDGDETREALDEVLI